jgi:hypothetical protein
MRLVATHSALVAAMLAASAAAAQVSTARADSSGDEVELRIG